MAGIRNRVMHESIHTATNPIDRSAAWHYLVTMSTFARWVDAAEPRDARNGRHT